ncbi:DUF559 domain-containing protein [Gordonia hydrophobica]|uniref:DUF559 domain-containing protein n=1 Tax=Gordonia hydrophobica TaxID=40516 RepID=A0ABZ2TVU2_9ACTN|nr:DUF559 domain-containing protein [Gordonia hydrophobica]MBM7365946.1 very-short-patch-repair endonuclease [Gordonia hydrophobica]
MARHIADHDGVVTAAEARDLGLTEHRVRHRVDTGLWTAEARAVYLSAEHNLTEAAQVRIAVAAHGGVADRTTAAWWHGVLDDLPSPLTVSVPRSTRTRLQLAFDAEAKRRTFPAEDLTVVRDLPVTDLPLTILQVAAEREDGIAIMDRALQERRVHLIDLRRSLERNAGSFGMRRARMLLEAAEDRSESAAERAFVKLLREHRIDGWTQQVPFCGYRLDFAWKQEQIGVEIHGWKFHKYHDRWDRDQQKANQLALMGWLPLSFSWARLVTEPDACMRELIEAIELRRAV